MDTSSHFSLLDRLDNFFLITILAAICLIGIVATVYFNVHLDPDWTLELSKYTWDPDYFHPKPREKWAYFSFLAAVLPVFYGVIRFSSAPIFTRLKTFIPRGSISVLGMGMFLTWSLVIFHFENWFYLHPTIFRREPYNYSIILGVFLFSNYCVRNQIAIFSKLSQTSSVKVLAEFAILIFLVFSFLVRIIPDFDPYVTNNSFECVFFPMTQVFAGKTVLVDVKSQYGLFPEFLAPVFHILGTLSVYNFTIVMAFLSLCVYILYLDFLQKVIKDTVILLGTFLGSLIFMEIFVPWIMMSQNYLKFYDPYFQINPIRLIFPMFFLSRVGRDLTSLLRIEEKMKARLISTLILGFGLFWNLDTGLPAFLSWLAYLAFDAVQLSLKRKSLFSVLGRIFAMGFGSILIPLLVLSVWLRCKSGLWVDWSEFFQAQVRYYIVGFGMKPTPSIHSWIILIAIYLMALAYCAQSVFLKKRSQLALVLFPVAIFGLAYFSYFQGKSHIWVFTAVAFPGFIVVAVVLDFFNDYFNKNYIYNIRVNLFPRNVFLGSLFLYLVGCYSTVVWAATHLEYHLQNIKVRIDGEGWDKKRADLEFVQEKVTPGSTVFFVSNHAGVYHAVTQTLSPFNTELLGFFEKREVEELIASLKTMRRIFVDKSVTRITSRYTNPWTNREVWNAIQKDYSVVSESASGYVFEMERKS